VHPGRNKLLGCAPLGLVVALRIAGKSFPDIHGTQPSDSAQGAVLLANGISEAMNGAILGFVFTA
jgi:hypothetical protein